MKSTPRRLAAVLGFAILFVSSALGQSTWRGDDVGSVGLAGRSTETSGVFEIAGAGTDIWERADAFHFMHQAWTGDGEMVARVTSQQATHGWAKVGVMLRETTQASSRHAFMCVTPGNGVALQHRNATGGDSISVGGGSGALPVWLKLTRAGNVVTGFTSTNGSTWTQVGAVSFSNLTASVEAGIAVTSHDASALSVARVDNVALRASSGPTTPPPPSGAPVVTAMASQSVNSGYLFTYQISATNSPTSYSATGLPAGLTLNSTTGEIRGVCGGNGGTYNVTLRATNAAGSGTASQTFVVSGSGPIEMPRIESVTAPAAGSYRAGDTLVFFVRKRSYYGPLQVTGRPRFGFMLGGNARFADYAWGSGSQDQIYAYTYKVTSADSGAAGIQTSDTIDLNGGTITDTYPLACALNMRTVSTAEVRCEAGGAAPTAAPVISTPDSVVGMFGQPFAFQITAGGAPTAYGATFGSTPARPLGVSLNTSTGVLTGTVAASGTYSVMLSATNNVGTATKPLTIVIPHVIASVALPTAGTYRAGDSLAIRLTFSVPVRPSDSPSLSLEIGQNWRQATHAFGSGQDHTFVYTIQAGDVDLDGYIGFGPRITGGAFYLVESDGTFPSELPRNLSLRNVIVDAPGAPPPQVTSPATATGTVGVAFSYTITATNSPTSFGAVDLPAGLSVNTTTGVISGAPTVSGTFYPRVSATNNGGTSSLQVQLTIAANSAEGWQSRDIGAVAAAGSSSETSGVVTVRGSGADIWEGADEFHFRYVQLASNGELAARVTSLGNTHPWAKAGIMFRNTLEANSPNLLLFVSRDNGLARQFRSRAGDQTIYQSYSAPTTFPTWLRVVRNSIWLESYTSSDGVNWTLLDQTYWDYTQPMYIGLAVTSHNDGTITSATFDTVRVGGQPSQSGPPSAPSLSAYAESAREVSLHWSDPGFTETGFQLERSNDGTTFALLATTGVNGTSFVDSTVNPSTTYHYRVRATSSEGPSPYSEVKAVTTPEVTTTPTWAFADIGAVGVAGSNSSSGNTIAVQASGADIWDTADSFRFVYRQIRANAVVEAQVTTAAGGHDWAKSGVMIRQSLAPDARNVFVFVRPQQIAVQARAVTGATTSIVGGPWVQAPIWLRLVRSGTRITAYWSYTGTTWTEIAGFDVSMADPVYAGFAVTSHNNAQLATAVFSDPYVE